MAKVKYDGTNPIYLNVAYGSSSTLVARDGTTTAIPVIIDSFDLNFNHKNSQNGQIPAVSINFKETI